MFINVYFAQFVDMHFLKLFVDSQAALQAQQLDTFQSKQALITSRDLDDLEDVVESLTLVWTKPHIRTPGNEMADLLAMQGSELDMALILTTPSSYVRGLIKEKAYQMWNAQWTTYLVRSLVLSILTFYARRYQIED